MCQSCETQRNKAHEATGAVAALDSREESTSRLTGPAGMWKHKVNLQMGPGACGSKRPPGRFLRGALIGGFRVSRREICGGTL